MSVKYGCLQRIYYIHDLPVYLYICGSQFTKGELFFDSLIKFVVGIWVPIAVAIVCHVTMYVQLCKQARFRSKSSSSISSDIYMRKISRKFLVIVLVFSICMLPGTVIWIHYTYLIYTEQFKHVKNKYFYDVGVDISWAVLNMSCCLNPFIYGKLHTKLLVFIRKRISADANATNTTKTRTVPNKVA